MAIKDRIRQARKEREISQPALGALLSVSSQAISQWETGKTVPETDKLSELAKALSVTVEWLLADDAGQINFPTKSTDSFRPVLIPGTKLVGDRDFPIYGAAAGGAAGHLIIDFNPIQYVRRPSILEGVRGSYGVRVDGESMVPAFRPGDYALVHPHMLPENDTDVVLFDHDPKTGTAEALIKHLVGTTDTMWKLEQYNPAKKFSEYKADWPICHRVVGRYDRRR